MSIQQVAAEAQAVVDRARSLFGSPHLLTGAGQALASAAESAAGVGQRTRGLSGELVDRHADFVGEQTRDLTNAGRTDTTLASQLCSAAAVTQSGARQLDAIAAQARIIAATADTARTPAAQRTVLAALRSQVSQANAVVGSTTQQAGDVADRISALTYRSGGRVQAAGHGTGDAKDAPPPPTHRRCPAPGTGRPRRVRPKTPDTGRST